MKKKEFPYSHIRHFQITDNHDKLEHKIRAFVDCGWHYIGQVTIAKSLFECVAWPREKGEVKEIK